MIHNKPNTVMTDDPDRGDRLPQKGGVLELEPKEELKEPDMFRVVLLNDDYTPMEFVVYVLQKHFKRSTAEAEKIMLDVHNKGAGTAGVFTYEVAEMKVLKVTQEARKEEHPLKVILEEDL